MKTLKHVFAIVLTIALLFALAAPAFASGSIEVLNPGTASYTAYKIFDVAEVDGELQYTVSDATLKAKMLEDIANGDLNGLSIDETTGVVTKLSNFKAADFAAWAKTNVSYLGTGTVLAEDAEGKMKATGLDDGYYLVVPSIDDRASLCTVYENDVAVQNKNDMPFDKKAEDSEGNWVDETGVAVGDTINFKITGKVPELDADQESYFYLVSDKLSDGLTFNKDVVVKVGGTEVAMTVVTDPNATLTGNQIRLKDNGFDLSLNMLDTAFSAGDEIEITYSAIVNENAVNVINTNEATLDYGDENSSSHKDSMTKHYTNEIIIDKYETGSPESKVPGAKFVLKNADGKFYKYVEAQAAVEDDPSTPEDEAQAAVAAHIEWITAANAEAAVAAGATEVTTNAEGEAKFSGLPDGTYTLIETEAPAGYAQLTDEIEVVVDGSASTAVGLTPAQVALALSEFVRVANTPGSLLPSTGGIGTKIFYIAGGLLVLAAVAVILIASRKKQVKAN